MIKKKNYNLIVGGGITGIIVVLLFIGLFFKPYNGEEMNAANKMAGISLSHIMGCDNMGRDIFSRVLDGLVTTLFVATGTVVIGAVVGTFIGAITGYYGGIIDETLMRLNDVLFSIPSILLALVFISILGTGTYNVMIALGIGFIPSYARVVRGEFLKCKSMDYVKSAKLVGVSNLRIMFVHILPNVLTVLVSSVMIGFNNAVLAEAGMSYLGIGVQPPDASLGRMLSEAQAYLFSTPSYAICVGMVIVMMVLGFSLLGEGIRNRKSVN